MLSKFVTANRAEIIARCQARVAARIAPRATHVELEHGIPLFLDQLALTLQFKLEGAPDVIASASKHGHDLLETGFTVAQVVNNYGDACQSITELAIERGTTFPTEDFKALNLCLDEAIAGAVTEYERQRELTLADRDARQATEKLGFFAHELRNLLGTAALAFDALRTGNVGVAGSTGATLGRSLTRMRDLVDRSLSMVRLDVGINAQDTIVTSELIEELEISAMMEAKAHGHELTIELSDGGAKVCADRQILASVLANLIQNAFKYSHPHSHVVLRVSATATQVRFEIEDHCGGLPPGKAETLFNPFEQRSSNRSGLGLGLAICMRGTLAIGGSLRVRDLPGHGCVFVVELPRVA